MITFANGNAANAVEVGVEAIGAIMTMIDVHEEIRDLHLPGVTAHRLALITAALRQDVTSILTFLEVVSVAMPVAIVDWTTADGIAHPPADDLSLGHIRLLLPQGVAIEIGMRSLRGLYIIDQCLTVRLPPSVENVIGTGDLEVQGAVIEQDPSHLQIPLAHDLPEDLGGGATHQSPHAAVLRHLGVDIPLHPYPGLVPVHEMIADGQAGLEDHPPTLMTTTVVANTLMIARAPDNANTGAAAAAPVTVEITAPDRARLCDVAALVRDAQGSVRLSDTYRAGGEGATPLLFPHPSRNDARRLTLSMKRVGK